MAKPPKGESANRACRPPSRRYPNQSPRAPGARVAGPDASRYVNFRAASRLYGRSLAVQREARSPGSPGQGDALSQGFGRDSRPTHMHTHIHTYMPPLPLRRAPGLCRTYGSLPIHPRWMRINTQPDPAHRWRCARRLSLVFLSFRPGTARGRIVRVAGTARSELVPGHTTNGWRWERVLAVDVVLRGKEANQSPPQSSATKSGRNARNAHAWAANARATGTSCL